MAKYAQINENGHVTNIVTIEEKVFIDENGEINDELAIRYLKNNHGGTWCSTDDDVDRVTFELSKRSIYQRLFDVFQQTEAGETVTDEDYIIKASNDNLTNSGIDIRSVISNEHVSDIEDYVNSDIDTYMSSFTEDFLNEVIQYYTPINYNRVPKLGDIYHEDTKTFSDGSPGPNYAWNWRTEQWEESSNI